MLKLLSTRLFCVVSYNNTLLFKRAPHDFNAKGCNRAVCSILYIPVHIKLLIINWLGDERVFWGSLHPDSEVVCWPSLTHDAPCSGAVWLFTHRRVGVSHISAMPGDINVEVFFCGLKVHGVVKVHALLVLQLPVSPHQVAACHRHRQQHWAEGQMDIDTVICMCVSVSNTVKILGKSLINRFLNKNSLPPHHLKLLNLFPQFGHLYLWIFNFALSN